MPNSSELTSHLPARIATVRGKRVILDSDLAALYGVSTKRFNEAVKRNLERFPVDFSFSLEDQDLAILRSQIATSSGLARLTRAVGRCAGCRNPQAIRSNA